MLSAVARTSSYRMLEKVNLGYSTKNIPLASNKSYKIKLIEKTEALIKRMRWKAIFFLSSSEEEDEEEKPETYGLPTKKSPTQVRELVAFESDLLKMVKNIEFRNTSCEFQSRMKQDVRAMRESGKTLTPADKTSNMYRLSKEQYNQMKTNAVTSKYKKASDKIKEKIEKGSVKFAKRAGVLDRMDQSGSNDCFITLKDHKDNFQNNPTTRLINPAKNEIGRISKVILDKINCSLKQKLGVNQWKSSQMVIDWFKAIENKGAYTFTVFDIKDFYPSIKETLLLEALAFAKTHVKILARDMETVRHARKSLLFDSSNTWIKRDAGLFDVTMGAFDGAEVCELVGTYLLFLISRTEKKGNIGLYRDDGLAVFKNTSGPQNERIKKKFQKIFKEKGLDLVIQCNMKTVDYLDVTFNLEDGSFRPYRKPDDETKYINVDSDHPPNIIKQLPISIEKRLSTISSSEVIFDQCKPHYQEALKKSGHSHELKYNPPQETGERRGRNRRRNIIWFNPPYSKSVATNVGKTFLDLLARHFPENNRLHKIFNKHNVKVSYGCMPSIGSKINAHNKAILGSSKPLERGGCNCNNRDDCPLDGECLSKNVLYEATITSSIPNYGEKIYIGISEPSFKERFANHKKSFNKVKYSKETALSKEVWRIKEKNETFSVKWKIRRQCPTYTPMSKKCALCMNEKADIVYYEGSNLLNKKSEIISTCRHRLKHSLGLYDVN